MNTQASGHSAIPVLAPAVTRQQYDARAPRFARHDALVREIERRLVERLDVIRLSPERIVDVGCAAGHSCAALQALYPRAQWLGVDLSLGMLQSAAAPPQGWRVCADACALPLAPESVDLLFSNLVLHLCDDPKAVFAHWWQQLRVGGLLMFSSFGPDTLRELRAACRTALPSARPLPYVDMHDLGDALLGAGFEVPVMDAEHLTLTYPDARALLREVRALGGNPRADRAPGLPGTAAAQRLTDALHAQRDAQGSIALTFEIVYGHAWKPASRRLDDGATAISLDGLRSRLFAAR